MLDTLTNITHKTKHCKASNINFITLMLGCLLLAGCDKNESDAKSAVIAILKDPDSAKFGEFTQYGDSLACITVNAKNSMGGYTGSKQAVLAKIEDRWQLATTLDIPHDECIKMLPTLETTSQTEKKYQKHHS